MLYQYRKFLKRGAIIFITLLMWVGIFMINASIPKTIPKTAMRSYKIYNFVPSIHDKRVDSPEPIEEEPLSTEEFIDFVVDAVVKDYPLARASVVKSIIWHESRYEPSARNGTCCGLMQVSTRWHANRAEHLGVEDFFDIEGSIKLGVDYYNELVDIYKSEYLALMVYHGEANAVEKFNNGETSWYADSVLTRAKSLEVQAGATSQEAGK